MCSSAGTDTSTFSSCSSISTSHQFFFDVSVARLMCILVGCDEEDVVGESIDCAGRDEDALVNPRLSVGRRFCMSSRKGYYDHLTCRFDEKRHYPNLQVMSKVLRPISGRFFIPFGTIHQLPTHGSDICWRVIQRLLGSHHVRRREATNFH